MKKNWEVKVSVKAETAIEAEFKVNRALGQEGRVIGDAKKEQIKEEIERRINYREEIVNEAKIKLVNGEKVVDIMTFIKKKHDLNKILTEDVLVELKWFETFHCLKQS